LNAARNDTAQDASAGYARRYWAPTTASFPHRVWCLDLLQKRKFDALVAGVKIEVGRLLFRSASCIVIGSQSVESHFKAELSKK
jgi:hypothetical protein